MPLSDTTITVIGTGYVGLTTAAILANVGFKVYALDISEARLAAIKSGRSFFFEEGLDPLIEKAVKYGSLIPTNSYEESIPESKFIFSCVGTPDNPDGSSNLDFVYQAAMTSKTYLNDASIYIQKSTVPVGTGRKIETLLSDESQNIAYLSNPEFLREGTALKDLLSSDRVVIGGDNQDAKRILKELYQLVASKRNTIAELGGIPIDPVDTKYFETTLESAELIKVTSNAFLALKISFANSIAKLADRTDADIVDIMDAVGADRRIGRSFLDAGRGYGGGCFPKDVSGLIASASDYGVDLPIMTAATDVNESMPGYIANKIQHELGTLKGKKIAVLGLAFKAGTSDARKSPGVKLANIISHAAATVTVHDPQASEEAATDLRKEILLASSIDEAVKNCDAVCVATNWKDYAGLDFLQIKSIMSGNIWIDCMNMFSPIELQKAGLKYIGVGRH